MRSPCGIDNPTASSTLRSVKIDNGIYDLPVRLVQLALRYLGRTPQVAARLLLRVRACANQVSRDRLESPANGSDNVSQLRRNHRTIGPADSKTTGAIPVLPADDDRDNGSGPKCCVM